jgi:PHD/YefM family antitoxin component YafN of YafNO toxin-antitoxin module
MPVLKELDLQYITDDTGQKTAVILKLADFEELMEDLEDLAVVAERRDETTVSHETLLSELRRDGILSD